MRLALVGLGILLLTCAAPGGGADLSKGEDRLGQPAPALELRNWLHSAPLEPKDLRGKVILIRWWTDGCPFCAATAPALRELDRKYRSRGLEVIGVFHPKPAGDASVERMRVASERLGFTFPVALDAEWTALGRWWPEVEQRGWTSVSFVVDTHGIIRYVHPGGEVHSGGGGVEHLRCEREYGEIERVIGELLGE